MWSDPTTSENTWNHEFPNFLQFFYSIVSPSLIHRFRWWSGGLGMGLTPLSRFPQRRRRYSLGNPLHLRQQASPAPSWPPCRLLGALLHHFHLRRKPRLRSLVVSNLESLVFPRRGHLETRERLFQFVFCHP